MVDMIEFGSKFSYKLILLMYFEGEPVDFCAELGSWFCCTKLNTFYYSIVFNFIMIRTRQTGRGLTCYGCHQGAPPVKDLYNMHFREATDQKKQREKEEKQVAADAKVAARSLSREKKKRS